MKPKSLSLIALLVLLLALGIFLIQRKAGGDAGASHASGEQNVHRPDQPGASSSEARARRDRSLNAQGELDEMEKLALIERDKIKTMWRGRASVALDQSCAGLIADFALDAGQADALREIFSRRKDRLTALMEEMFSDGPKDDRQLIHDICSLLRNKGLREDLAAVLSRDQMKAYDAREERRENDSVEAKTYKDMAEISSVVRLKDSQKQDLLRALKAHAPARLEQEADSRAFMSLQFGAIATEVDSFVVQGLANMMHAGVEGANLEYGGNEHQEWMERRRTERIESELSAVRGVLDEDQLARYREHLEKQPPL